MPKYYDGGQLLSHKLPFSMVVGIRSVGKTYWFTRYAIKLGLQQKSKAFVWIRRFIDDVDEIRPTFFDDMMINNEFPEWKFEVKGSLAYAINRKTEEKFVIGEFMALTEHQRKKSSPRPTVKIVVFDECLTEDRYLKDEVQKLFSITYSVFRTERQVRVILLSNAVSTVNPYFDMFGITNIEKNFTKTERIVVENCDYAEFREYAKQSSFGKLVEGTRYADYAIDNKFLLDDFTDVKPMPDGLRDYSLNVKLNGILIGMWIVNGIVYFGNATEPTRQTYTMYVEDAKLGGAIYLDKKHEIFKFIANNYANGSCLFETINIKNEIVLVARAILKNF